MRQNSRFPINLPIPATFPRIRDIIGRTDSLFFKCFPSYAFDELTSTRRILHERFVLINGAEDIARVLINSTNRYVRSGFWNKQVDPLLGQSGIFLSGDAMWRRQRRVTQQQFRPSSLAVHAADVLSAAERWLDTVPANSNGTPLCDQLSALVLQISVKRLLSIKLAGRVGPILNTLIHFAELMTMGGFADLALPAWLPTALNRQRAATQDAWMKCVDQLLAERLAAPDPVQPDLVSACLADPDLNQLDPDELRDQVATFIVASYESTAFTIRWAVCLMATSDEWQERIAREVADVELSSLVDKDVTARSGMLPQLNAFIRETLRLYPPIKVFGRDAVTDDTLGDVEVRRGDRVVISPWVLHRHRLLWSDPDQFRPERFLPSSPEVPRLAYLPFGVGPRICIGAAMANLTVVFVLAALVQRYRIVRVDDHVIMPRALGAGMVPSEQPRYRLENRAAERPYHPG